MALAPSRTVDKIAAFADRACVARCVVVNKNEVAGLHMSDIGPDFLRPADDLMAEDGADFLGEVPGHQVAGADAAHGGAQQDLARWRKVGFGTRVSSRRSGVAITAWSMVGFSEFGIATYNVGPMLQGANSSSPTPLISLLVFLPLATARISSKICWPTASTGVPVENHAGVDVHVVDHVVVHRRVGGHLDRRRRFAAEDGAAPGREDQHVGAAGDDAGHADGIVAGRVHDDEALGPHRLGVADDIDQGGAASLGDGAERLFVDGGQAAFLVAGGGIVVDLGAENAGVPFPPFDAFDQLFADCAADGPARQQMFRAVDLRRFAQDRSCRPGRPADPRRCPGQGWR